MSVPGPSLASPPARRKRRTRSAWRRIVTRERQRQAIAVAFTLALMALAVLLTLYLIR